MKRLLFLAVSVAAIQLLLHCAQPLESTSDPVTVIVDTIETVDTVAGDTVVITDTVTIIDSTGGIDTIVIIDTIVLVDTLFIIDTVIINDTTFMGTFCGTLPSDKGSSRKTIAWFLSNQEGLFKLEFVAIIESGKPPQTLEVNINGTIFEWRPVDSLEYTVDMDLRLNSTVTVSSTSPHAYGHAIDVCLKITPI